MGLSGIVVYFFGGFLSKSLFTWNFVLCFFWLQWASFSFRLNCVFGLFVFFFFAVDLENKRERESFLGCRFVGR